MLRLSVASLMALAALAMPALAADRNLSDAPPGTQPHAACSAGKSDHPACDAPSDLRPDGTMPNGLLPNPFNYG